MFFETIDENLQDVKFGILISLVEIWESGSEWYYINLHSLIYFFIFISWV